MEQNEKKEVWWKPGVEIFGKVSGWVVVPIIAGLIIGKYLDGLYGTKPWIFLSLTCIAFLISSFGIVRTIRAYMEKLNKEEKNGRTNKSK